MMPWGIAGTWRGAAIADDDISSIAEGHHARRQRGGVQYHER